MVLRWVTQRQSDAKVFKKYSQMKLQMKREALAKLNRQPANWGPGETVLIRRRASDKILVRFWYVFRFGDRRGE
jgi:hypothetical protein